MSSGVLRSSLASNNSAGGSRKLLKPTSRAAGTGSRTCAAVEGACPVPERTKDWGKKKKKKKNFTARARVIYLTDIVIIIIIIIVIAMAATGRLWCAAEMMIHFTGKSRRSVIGAKDRVSDGGAGRRATGFRTIRFYIIIIIIIIVVISTKRAYGVHGARGTRSTPPRVYRGIARTATAVSRSAGVTCVRGGSERFDIRPSARYRCVLSGARPTAPLKTDTILPSAVTLPVGEWWEGGRWPLPAAATDGRASALYFRPSTPRTVDKSNRVRRSKP
jgi:flagellar basal body-associated protein FliL